MDTPIRKGKEKMIVERTLNNFDAKCCCAWKALTSQFSTGIRHPELLSIAEILVNNYKLPDFGRTGKRSYACLIKWFDDNWTDISKIIGRFTLLDQNDSPISGHREIVDYCRS